MSPELLTDPEQKSSVEIPLVSVVIPVYNGADYIGQCLAALARQSYPSSRIEIIVVDNASEDRDQLEDVVGSYPGVRLDFESEQGSYAARNRGIAIARGDVLAFTDADCIPGPEWIEQGTSTLQDCENCGLVAGKVDVCYQNGSPYTAAEYYEWLRAFRQEQFLKQYRGAVTANLFTYRDVLDRVGFFKASLKSGGDLEWGRRVYCHRYTQVYCQEAKVAHPARSSWSELIRKTRRVTGGVYDLYVSSDPSLAWYQREKVFYRLIIDDIHQLVTTVSEAWRCTHRDPKVFIALLSATTIVGVTSILEKCRLKFGGQSRRC